MGQGALDAISAMLPVTVITCILLLPIKCCQLPLLFRNPVILMDTREPSFITACPVISLSLQRIVTTELLCNGGVFLSSAFLITTVNETFPSPFQAKSASGFSSLMQ